MRRVGRDNDRFEREFWKSEDIDSFYEARGKGELPSAKVLAAGIAEWRRSTTGRNVDREGTRARLMIAMASAVGAETDKLAARLNILATVGSVAPFVGLFGTVWGVYHALVAIGISGSGALDQVAGPVGEALIMTGIGLAVALPAVMGYNWLTRSNRVLTAKLDAFAFELLTFLSMGQALQGSAQVTPLKPGGLSLASNQ
jgi:biopolymer transport protein TolQ